MSGLTLDAGALIAFDRGDREVVALITVARRERAVLSVPAGVVAQVWRDGRRQARLAALLASSTIAIEPLTDARARAAGQLCGARGTSDIVDASVVLSALEKGNGVVTSEPGDLRELAPKLRLVRV